MVEKAVSKVIDQSGFKPGDYHLNLEIMGYIANFLKDLWKQGVLSGYTKDQAYYIHCNSDDTLGSFMDVGSIIIEIGVAPFFPGEFVVLRMVEVKNKIIIIEVNDF